MPVAALSTLADELLVELEVFGERDNLGVAEAHELGSAPVTTY